MIPITHLENLITARERAVMARVLEEERARREHLVVHLSGSHAYGFPSPDSDLDLKAIHIASTAELLGFDVPASTVDRAEIIDGVEIDYTSNELAPALTGILGGNGNFIERVLGRTAPYASGLLDELRPLARRALSRRVHRHYSGFARNQLRSLEKEPTVKRLLYVLRTALTGIHLLETGEVEPNLGRLMGPYRLAEAAELIERKRAGERAPLEPALLARWTSRVEALLHRLDEARAESPLPAEPPNKGELSDWLLAVRRARLG
jgi:predicted nucleotidyltransferase